MSTARSNPVHLEHHFSDAEQQRESAKMGMWVFLGNGNSALWWLICCLWHIPGLVSGYVLQCA